MDFGWVDVDRYNRCNRRIDEVNAIGGIDERDAIGGIDEADAIDIIDEQEGIARVGEIEEG